MTKICFCFFSCAFFDNNLFFAFFPWAIFYKNHFLLFLICKFFDKNLFLFFFSHMQTLIVPIPNVKFRYPDANMSAVKCVTNITDLKLVLKSKYNIYILVYFSRGLGSCMIIYEGLNASGL